MKTVGNTHFVSMTEAKANLPKLVDEHSPKVLLRHNEPVAALVSIEDFNAHLALQALIQHPELLEDLRAKADEARVAPLSKLHTMEELEKLFVENAPAGSASEVSDADHAR